MHTGEIPVVGKNIGRPSKPFEDWEISLVKQAYEKYRTSADTLERIILRDESKQISHNRIHKILLELGYAKKRRKNPF